MAIETQLANLRAQLEAKRRKVLEDPDIPSQILDQMTKEMHSLFHEIQALESELKNAQAQDTDSLLRGQIQ